MKNESEKNAVRIDITKKQDDQQNPSPSKDTKVEQTELTVNELEERIAPLRF